MDIIFPGGLYQRHMQPKVIIHVFNDRALFDIYRNYIEMLRGNPPDNSEDGGPFYRRAFDTNYTVFRETVFRCQQIVTANEMYV